MLMIATLEVRRYVELEKVLRRRGFDRSRCVGEAQGSEHTTTGVSAAVRGWRLRACCVLRAACCVLVLASASWRLLLLGGWRMASWGALLAPKTPHAVDVL